MNQNERGLIGSCRHCLCWGDLYGSGVCPSCRGRSGWRVGHCLGCDRRVRVLHGHCRLCRVQAIHELGKMRLRGPVPPEVKLTYWQLFLTGFGQGYELHAAPQPQPDDVHTPTLPVTCQIPGQLALFTCPRDFTRFDRHTHANSSNETLIHARTVARDIAEARGWSHHLVDEIDDALVVLLSAHAPGDRLTYTEIGHVDRLGYNVSRTAEVIDYLGLLDDDRTDTTNTWLTGKLTQLPRTIADDIQAWADSMRHGGPRTKPRATATMRNYLGAMLAALTIWSAGYDYLRQVTRDDVRRHLGTLTGLPRKRCLVGLRSLFRYCKRTGRVFCDPTTHLRAGNVGNTVPMPLPDSLLGQAVQACTTSAHRLILAMAAIHAARPVAVRRMMLDDVDLPNRRITINGHCRRLDDITAALLDRYLTDRQRRWPHTLNQHLFLSEQTGHDQRPVSEWWLDKPLRGLNVTLKQINMDRQLEEALNHGPDALHLAVVFGIGERTAMRYADAARELLRPEQAQQPDPRV
jgi:integrase